MHDHQVVSSRFSIQYSLVFDSFHSLSFRFLFSSLNLLRVTLFNRTVYLSTYTYIQPSTWTSLIHIYRELLSTTFERREKSIFLFFFWFFVRFFFSQRFLSLLLAFTFFHSLSSIHLRSRTHRAVVKVVTRIHFTPFTLAL